jgi:hypothetical protein
MCAMTQDISSKLAFIIGHYKSGSTWLAHLLSLYPGIRGVRETHIFRYTHKYDMLNDATKELLTESAWAAGGIKRFPYFWLGNITRGIRTKLGFAKGTASLSNLDVPTSMHDLGITGLFQIHNLLAKAHDADEYCYTFFQFLLDSLKPERYLVEKTPTNIFYVEHILELFPNAKLISIHRDGRDVVVSDMYHLKRVYKKSQNFKERVNKWKQAMELELEYRDKYKIHQISYEELKKEPATTTIKLLEFLELEYNDDLINSMIDGSSFESMSGGRKAGEENSNKFHRKGIIGDWHNNLTTEEIDIFSKLAGDLLVELQYENSPNCTDWT